MRRLSKVVNIVPVIAKADTLTLEERDFFKKKVTTFWPFFLTLSHEIQKHPLSFSDSMLAFFHVCGAVTGDRISSCGFLRWFSLVLSSLAG